MIGPCTFFFFFFKEVDMAGVQCKFGIMKSNTLGRVTYVVNIRTLKLALCQTHDVVVRMQQMDLN